MRQRKARRIRTDILNVMLADPDGHWYALDIAHKAELSIGEAAPALALLEADGWATSQFVEHNDPFRPPRRCYQLTGVGMREGIAIVERENELAKLRHERRMEWLMKPIPWWHQWMFLGLAAICLTLTYLLATQDETLLAAGAGFCTFMCTMMAIGSHLLRHWEQHGLAQRKRRQDPDDA